VIKSPIDRRFKIKVMKDKPSSSENHQKTKTPCGLARKNSGVRVAILRAEALFFLDFLWSLSCIKARK
jgi:hypothetical protein